MNIFEKIKYRRDASILLNHKTFAIFKDILFNNIDRIKEGDQLLDVAINNVNGSVENKLHFNKKINTKMQERVFSPLLKMFLSFKVYNKNGEMNISKILADFDTYIQYIKKFNKEIRILKGVFFATIVSSLSIFFGFTYYMLHEIGIDQGVGKPRTTTTGIAQANPFEGFYHLEAERVMIIIYSLLLTIIAIYIFNKVVKSKIFLIQKNIDAYLMNILVYHSIMNSYFKGKGNNKGKLNYFYFKSIVRNITKTLGMNDDIISEDDKIKYYIYALNTQKGYTILNNEHISGFMNNYYTQYERGINKGFDKIESDITAIYQMKKSNLFQFLEDEFIVFQGKIKFINLSLLTAMMFGFMGLIMVVSNLMINSLNM